MGFRKVRGKKIPVWLTKNELRAMRLAADNVRDQILIVFGYYTGFRVSEISNCQLRDISFEENTIKVRQGKGCKDRIIALHSELKAILKVWLKDIKDSNTYVFPGQNDKPLGPRQIHRLISCTAYRAGLDKKVHPHTLRHSIAQHLRRDGHDLITISRFLGHEDVSTTQIYADADVTDQQKMMDAFR